MSIMNKLLQAVIGTCNTIVDAPIAFTAKLGQEGLVHTAVSTVDSKPVYVRVEESTQNVSLHGYGWRICIASNPSFVNCECWDYYNDKATFISEMDAVSIAEMCMDLNAMFVDVFA